MEKSRRVCSLVPKIHTKEISDRQCSTHQRTVCQPISKQVCNDVNEPRQVCNDVPEEVCDNVAASVTKYVVTSSAPILEQENVLQPRDKSAMMWWSRFQDKPSRPNARLNTFKSALNLVVEVTKISSLLTM